MNHKRGKPKSSRAGCLFCKPHKHQAAKRMTVNQPMTERKAREAERQERHGLS